MYGIILLVDKSVSVSFNVTDETEVCKAKLMIRKFQTMFILFDSKN